MPDDASVALARSAVAETGVATVESLSAVLAGAITAGGGSATTGDVSFGAAPVGIPVVETSVARIGIPPSVEFPGNSSPWATAIGTVPVSVALYAIAFAEFIGSCFMIGVVGTASANAGSAPTTVA